MTEWEPATEVEAAMRDALRASDQELYFRILSRIDLLLPVSAEALAGHAPIGWGTWTTAGRTHVLAFTSPAAVQACLAQNAGPTRRVPYTDLAHDWPNPEWWLAVNPSLPIEGYLPAWFVTQLAKGDVRLPGRTMGARARLERVENAARARATAVVPGPAESAPPTPPGDRQPAGYPPVMAPRQPVPPPESPPPSPGPADPLTSGRQDDSSGSETSAWLAAAYRRSAPPTESADRDAPAAPVNLFDGYEPPVRATPAAPGGPVPPVDPAGEMPSYRSTEPVGQGFRPIVIEGTVVESRSAEPGTDVPPAPEPDRSGGLWAASTPVVDPPEPAASEPLSEVFPGGPSPAEPLPDEQPVPPGTPGAADFQPANEVEENLLAAAGGGSTDTFLSTLLLARVLLPVAVDSAPGTLPGQDGFVWATEQLDGEPYVVVYTSPERLADRDCPPVETVQVKFVQLIRRWPDENWSFAVNPGTPVGAKLPGGQIVALANWAAEVGLGDDVGEPVETPAPAEVPAPRTPYAPAATDPGRPPMMQKTVAPSQLAYYLERGYDRISGFVHRANEVAHLNTPARLHSALGLAYPGSPFSPDDGEVYVLRWPAHRPSLYRIPYGGQTEVAMRAMEGWVIERPPFRGNGFAPGESSDVIAEFKVDSARLPHGAQLWRIGADGSERVVATLDSDSSTWRRVDDK
ncbi:SseB family protein [Micromonospora sp. CPCC 206060]|uniref:SseB family protein n=1 Tax=Micromonospora sp. CPCC 206060 TaxID=3122406 RepID=UPI002FF24643